MSTFIDRRVIQNSLANLRPEQFYLDGVNQLTSAEVYENKLPVAAVLLGFKIWMREPRTVGFLSFQLLKNGTPITGGFFQINADDPEEGQNLAINEPLNPGDTLTAEVTTVGFGPLENVGNFSILIK